MADSLPEQKTEMPTDRRIGELRKEGSVFQSVDIVQAFVLIAGFLALTMTWNLLYNDMRYLFIKSFTMG